VREVERAALVYVYASLLGGPKELPEDAKNLVAAVFAYKRTAGERARFGRSYARAPRAILGAACHPGARGILRGACHSG
jgi:hypothetical protein